jgi:hypothetical protein
MVSVKSRQGEAGVQPLLFLSRVSSAATSRPACHDGPSLDGK